ncbi:hypothetical protein [Methylogaea oryzae]|uniref:hypothetical protein n=1 Tax=Methylogaea oryzae TaxID=1295382 RepID=UPI0006D0A2A5|nr:hypothetical protein [Methylogaea oryzae]
MPPTVVELFGAKVKKLPPETLDVLVFCACMGNRFTAEDIALILELELLALFERLKPVLSMGLLMESKSELQFVHDRVQEAVLRLLDAERRRAIHWRIGHHLLQAVPAGKALAKQDNLFTIAAHLNLGRPEQLDKAATLTLIASTTRPATRLWKPSPPKPPTNTSAPPWRCCRRTAGSAVTRKPSRSTRNWRKPS